jgi:hypothetical protein
MDIKTYLSNGKKVVHLKSIKSMNPWDVDDNTGWSNETHKLDDSKLVPILYAAWQIRCKAMADLPFCIYKGDTAVDDSDDWKNVVGFLPDPRYFLWMSEAALCGTGSAYWFNEHNRAKALALRYWKPSSVTANLDSEAGLTGFKRNYGKGWKPYDVEDVFHVWLPDPDVEIGPPTTYPVLSAVTVASTVESMNTFVREFMDRGAVKAFLLSVSGTPPKSETEKLEKTWNSAGGLKGLLWRAFNKDKVEPVIIGEGIEALRGVTIVDVLQKQVLQAMGVPMSKVLANAANYATALQDDKAFYQNAIVPDARLIGDCLNEQILGNMGYRIEFEPGRLECFQENQNETSQALSTYAAMFQNNLKGAVIAFAIMGRNIPEEAQKLIDAALKEKEENKEQMEEQLAGNGEAVEPEEAEEENKPLIAEMDKFYRKAIKKIGADVPFESAIIPPDMLAALHTGLPGCIDKDAVKALFAQAHGTTSTPAPAYSEAVHVLEAMRLEVEAIKAGGKA